VCRRDGRTARSEPEARQDDDYNNGILHGTSFARVTCYRVKITRTPPPALSMDLIRFLAGFLLNSDRVITIVYFAIGLVLAGDQHKRDVLNRSIDVVTDFVILGDYDFGRCLVCHAL